MVFKLADLCITAFLIGSITSFMIPSTEYSEEYDVEFLSVVFRHGDRTPEESYPNDPHINYIHSTGFGDLTLAGKARAYEFGTQLREYYNDFLGELYKPYLVKARSTDYDRTKMSLMLVLSGLYPPRGEQIWNPTLNWQPIPISYSPRTKDYLTGLKSCPLYIQELIKVQNSDEVEAKVDKYRPLMVNLTQLTGTKINSSIELLLLYHTLMAEYSMGLELPEWTRDIFPKGLLRDATILRLQILNYNNKLRRLFSGVLLRNIIDTMSGIANGTINDRRKIHLFSAHETNVASFLMTLGVFEPHIPEYSSGVIVELLRNKHKQYYVGILYYLGIPSDMKVLHIPDCQMNPCPLEKFIHLMADVMPKDEDVECLHK